jgi:anthranilate/para-aminobenzoate synthase component II
MLLVITRHKPDNVNQLSYIYDVFHTRKIPYKIVSKCDSTIIRRKDICGLIYLFHFPTLPVLGICHGCQFLMTYYGGDLIPYESYWNKTVKIELSGHPIFRCEEDTRKLDVYVYFHDLPVMNTTVKKAGVREIAWFSQFRDGKRHACAFEFEKGRVYGFMFHPEAKKETHAILYNFYDIASSYSSA